MIGAKPGTPKGHNPDPATGHRATSLVGFGSWLCENSDVELAHRNFVSITLNRKRTALAAQSKGGQGRKQFCAFSARARFHTARVIFGSRHRHRRGLLCPHKRTSSVRPVRSENL